MSDEEDEMILIDPAMMESSMTEGAGQEESLLHPDGVDEEDEELELDDAMEINMDDYVDVNIGDGDDKGLDDEETFEDDEQLEEDEIDDEDMKAAAALEEEEG